jgi:hypothetical protein
MTSNVDDRQSLYAMRALGGLLKVGRSCDVTRRSRQLSADVIRVWLGLGRLEPSIHRLLEDFRVSREVFDCPLEVVEFVVGHVQSLDVYIKDSNTRLSNELRRWRPDSDAGAAPESAHTVSNSPGGASSSGVSRETRGTAGSGEAQESSEGESGTEGGTTRASSLFTLATEEDSREAEGRASKPFTSSE